MRPSNRSAVRRSKSDAYTGSGAGPGGVGRVNAIHSPSGLKTGDPPSPSIWKASPAGWSMRRNQVLPPLPPSPPGRFDVKTSRRPSGDQAGPEALKLGLVSRTGSSPPAASASQIPLWLRFSSSRTDVMTNATRDPSGEMAGLFAFFSR